MKVFKIKKFSECLSIKKVLDKVFSGKGKPKLVVTRAELPEQYHNELKKAVKRHYSRDNTEYIFHIVHKEISKAKILCDKICNWFGF